jgi:hypothetical protein
MEHEQDTPNGVPRSWWVPAIRRKAIACLGSSKTRLCIGRNARNSRTPLDFSLAGEVARYLRPTHETAIREVHSVASDYTNVDRKRM